MGPHLGPDTSGPTGLVGRIVGGYQLCRVLGTGVTGAVLLGNLAGAPDHQAAVRVLMLPLQTPEAVRAEFRSALAREAHTLFALRHPHILRVYAFGEDVVTDFPYIVLPYMPGGSLADRLADGPLSLAEVASQLTDLASALDYAHSRGIVHGDVKPANVLYDARGQVQLADFGIARLFDTVYGATAAAGLGQGSAAYLAPEQALGEPVGPPADLYSLGVVLYHMVTGHVPFEGPSPAAVMLKHVRQAPPSPRSVRPGLPEAAEAAILRALAKEPSERFPAAGALAQAFARAISAAAEVASRPLPVATHTEPAPREETPAVAVPIQVPVRTPLHLLNAQAPQSPTEVQPLVQPEAQSAPTATVPVGSGRSATADSETSALVVSPTAVSDAPAAPEPVVVLPSREEQPGPESSPDVPPEATAEAPAQASAYPEGELATPGETATNPAEPAPQRQPASVAEPVRQSEPPAAQPLDEGTMTPPPAREVASQPAPEPQSPARPAEAPAAPAAASEEPTAIPALVEPIATGQEPETAKRSSLQTSSAVPSPKLWLTPTRLQAILLGIFFGVLGLVAIPLVFVVGIAQVFLMVVVLALLAFIVLAVPAQAGAASSPTDTPPRRP